MEDNYDTIEDISARVSAIVEQKKQEYRRQAFCDPNFVKMPFWIFSIMGIGEYGTYYRPANACEEKYYHGLRVCPTYAIFDISQIEVF